EGTLFRLVDSLWNPISRAKVKIIRPFTGTDTLFLETDSSGFFLYPKQARKRQAIIQFENGALGLLTLIDTRTSGYSGTFKINRIIDTQTSYYVVCDKTAESPALRSYPKLQFLSNLLPCDPAYRI